MAVAVIRPPAHLPESSPQVGVALLPFLPPSFCESGVVDFVILIVFRLWIRKLSIILFL